MGKLQTKQTTCADLSEEDFSVLGEYFMGQMIGTSHEAMNTMMEQMMGKEGEEQMHVVMGKRLSGCDTSAAIPSQGVGFMPMMQMMMGACLPVRQGGRLLLAVIIQQTTCINFENFIFLIRLINSNFYNQSVNKCSLSLISCNQNISLRSDHRHTDDLDHVTSLLCHTYRTYTPLVHQRACHIFYTYDFP